MSDIAKIRLKIEALLQKSCDEKCLRGGSDLALSHLDQAETIAKTALGQSDLWLAAVRYRKGHLLMRAAGEKKRGAKACFIKAHECFLSAAAFAPFAIRARLYALPAGLRGGVYTGRNAPGMLADTIALARKSHAEPTPRFATAPQTEPLDNLLANLIELTAYYWGTWNRDMEGFSRNPLFPNGDKSDAWILFGNDPDLSKIRLEKNFAVAELDGILANKAHHLAVKQGDTGKWLMKTGDSAWKNLTETAFMPLLASLLYRRDQAVQRRPSSPFEPNTPDNRRQHKSRLKKFLSERIGFDAAPFVENEAGEERINPNLLIFGVARENWIRQGR